MFANAKTMKCMYIQWAFLIKESETIICMTFDAVRSLPHQMKVGGSRSSLPGVVCASLYPKGYYFPGTRLLFIVGDPPPGGGGLAWERGGVA